MLAESVPELRAARAEILGALSLRYRVRVRWNYECKMLKFRVIQQVVQLSVRCIIARPPGDYYSAHRMLLSTFAWYTNTGPIRQ